MPLATSYWQTVCYVSWLHYFIRTRYEDFPTICVFFGQLSKQAGAGLLHLLWGMGYKEPANWRVYWEIHQASSWGMADPHDVHSVSGVLKGVASGRFPRCSAFCDDTVTAWRLFSEDGTFGLWVNITPRTLSRLNYFYCMKCFPYL